MGLQGFREKAEHNLKARDPDEPPGQIRGKAVRTSAGPP
jgi:hypothetical protein